MWRTVARTRRVCKARCGQIENGGFVFVSGVVRPCNIFSVLVRRCTGAPLQGGSRESSAFGGEEHLASWTAPGPTVYANPVCSQLDQLLLKCADFDEVLALLTTHRGVFFVHNLVTALQMLASISVEEDALAVNELLRDPRYDVLLRDVTQFIPTLDFLAMTNVACCLWQLEHKHYRLLTKMLRPLYQATIPDVGTLLRCAKAYAWAGYHTQHKFYAHCATALVEAMPDISSAQLVEACVLFGSVTQYSPNFFESARIALLSRGLQELDLHSTSLLAAAFAAHMRRDHDELFTVIATLVESEAPRMSHSDIVLCLDAFRRVALRFDGAVVAGLAACAEPLRRAWVLRQKAELRTAEVATLLDCASLFGISSEFHGVALDYLHDQVDEMSESAAISTVHSMCLAGGSLTHPFLLLYLFRKIGRGSAWEAQRLRVFHIWVSQLLQFPWLEARMPRRCLSAGLRAWCLQRGGYGSPFPEDVREVAEELSEMGLVVRTFVPVLNTPYEADVVLGPRKDALLVFSETARNTLDLVGSALLQCQHMRARGWRVVPVPLRVWRSLEGCERKRYLQALVDVFEVGPLTIAGS